MDEREMDEEWKDEKNKEIDGKVEIVGTCSI